MYTVLVIHIDWSSLTFSRLDTGTLNPGRSSTSDSEVSDVNYPRLNQPALQFRLLKSTTVPTRAQEAESSSVGLRRSVIKSVTSRPALTSFGTSKLKFVCKLHQRKSRTGAEPGSSFGSPEGPAPLSAHPVGTPTILWAQLPDGLASVACPHLPATECGACWSSAHRDCISQDRPRRK